MRAAVGKHGASDLVVDQEVMAALEHASSGAFVEAERVSLVGQLRARIARASGPVRVALAAQATQPATPAPVEGAIPEAPELAGADRERFVEAFRAAARGDVTTAWTMGKPLFGTYPRSMNVQDLRCRVASRSMPFDVARKECALLMNLSSSRSAPSDGDQLGDSVAPKVTPKEEFLVVDHGPDHPAEDCEIAQAQEVIAGCYRVTCPEIVLVSAPGTPAEIASVCRALQERGGDVELLIDAYRGACLGADPVQASLDRDSAMCTHLFGGVAAFARLIENVEHGETRRDGC